jgi:hypothetical protein
MDKMTNWCIGDHTNDIFFKFFLKLCHCLTSEDAISIKWQHLKKAYLHSEKTRLKNATTIKSEAKCDEKEYCDKILPLH